MGVNPSIRTRVLVGLAALSSLTVAVCLGLLLYSHHAVRCLETASTEVLRYIAQVDEAQTLVDDLHGTVLLAMAGGDFHPAAEQRRLDRQSVRFLDLVETIRDPTAPGMRQQQDLLHGFQAYHLLARKVLDSTTRTPQTLEAFAERERRLDIQLERYRSHHAGNVEQSLGEMRTELDVLARVAAVATLTSLAIAGVMALFVWRRLGRPLSALLDVARALGRGELAVPSLACTPDEVGLLGCAFNDLSEKLRHREAERDRYEEELRKSQGLQAAGRLAGGVAHDFNNLLGSVLGCVYAARIPGSDPATAASELDRIQDLCKQGAELTRNLLAVAGQAPGQSGPLELASELQRLRVLVERTCGRAVTAVFEVADDLPRVRGDRALINAILLNLCLNARDAMPGGGTLRVCASRRTVDGRDWAAVAVADSGEGVPPELTDLLFQPFFSTKHKARGAGLGLSTALAMAQQMGGTIDLENRPGRGATFTLRLPALAAQPAALPTPPGAAPGAPTAAPAGPILLVEDEEGIARMVVDALTRRGYPTLRATNGLEALERVRESGSELALVLLDLVLPTLPGAAVHRVLKATVPNLPVVFLTGREDLAAEIDPETPVLAKPFTEEELLACVHAVAAGTRGRPDPAQTRAPGVASHG